MYLKGAEEGGRLHLARKEEEKVLPRERLAGPVTPLAAARLNVEHVAQRAARCDAQVDLFVRNERGELGDASSGKLVAQHVESPVLVVPQLTYLVSWG